MVPSVIAEESCFNHFKRENILFLFNYQSNFAVQLLAHKGPWVKEGPPEMDV